MIAPAPITLDQLPPEWIETRREIIARDGYALRAGPSATIEIKSQAPHEHLAANDPLLVNVWCVIGLPGGAKQFQRVEDRDAVLQQLQGTMPVTPQTSASNPTSS